MENNSIFDMIGPVMIGPSSSHTAGVARIGRVAHHILGNQPSDIDILFYNSFSATYQGHGSDRAIIGGLMDFHTDDPNIKNALEIAKENNINIQFKGTNHLLKHPNTVEIFAQNTENKCTVIGESLGGGVINITAVDGYKCSFSAMLPTLIIKSTDHRGSLAFLADVITHEDCNIASLYVSRKEKQGEGCFFIELDSEIRQTTIDYLKTMNWVRKIIYLNINNL